MLSYFSVAFNIIAGLLYTPWMVHQIGQSQYGLYTLASSLITLFLVDFGLSSATARYISRYKAQNDEESINNFLGTIYQLYLILDAVILTALIVIYFFTDQIYKTLAPEELQQFKVVYGIAAIYSVISFPFVTLNGVLTAHELFIQQKMADLIQRALTIFLVIIALINGMGLYALVMANAFSGIGTIALKLLMIRRRTNIHVRFHQFDKTMLKELFGFSIWITIASLAQRLIFNITPSILGMMASSSAIAVFGIVATIEGYTYTITNAINGMFMPKISRIVVGGDQETSLQSLLLRVGRYQYALNGLIVVGFFSIGREFILLWMGANYLKAYAGVLLVLIPGLFYNALQIGHTTVIVQNKVKITALVSVASGLINVTLSYFLSKRWGVFGASLSIFVAYMFRAMALMLFYNRNLPLDIPGFCKKCYLQFAPVIISTVLIGFLIKRVFPISGWFSLAVDGSLICLIYLAMSFGLGLNKTERKKIKEVFNSRIAGR